jgi:hypothetical protein
VRHSEGLADEQGREQIPYIDLTSRVASLKNCRHVVMYSTYNYPYEMVYCIYRWVVTPLPSLLACLLASVSVRPSVRLSAFRELSSAENRALISPRMNWVACSMHAKIDRLLPRLYVVQLSNNTISKRSNTQRPSQDASPGS